jgi:hypothetical protein
MPFSRIIEPAGAPHAAALTADLVAIGLNFAAEPAKREPNIEDTLLFASDEAMERDLRLLAVLVTWFGVHHPWVNADRLTRLVREHPSMRVLALWAALARWRRSDHRFARMAKLHRGPRVDAESDGSDFLIRRHGEDPRFAQGPIRVAANLLRDRPADVLEPAALARRHAAYRWRVLIGPSYRADMWAALEEDPTLSSAELARRAYGSFATAWHVRRDFAVLRGTVAGAAGRVAGAATARR